MAATSRPADSAPAKSDYTDFAHTGLGTLAGRFMRTFWQPVMRTKDLLPGHATPLRIIP